MPTFIQNEALEKDIKNNIDFLEALKENEEREINKIKNDLFIFTMLIAKYSNLIKNKNSIYENDNYIIKEDVGFNINIYKKIKIKKIFKKEIVYKKVLTLDNFYWKEATIKSFNIDLIQEAYDSIYNDLCFKIKQKLKDDIDKKIEKIEYLKLLHFEE